MEATMHAPIIRDAVSHDHDFVVASMNDALEPYYGGDHSAHAERIFQTHLAGGKDKVGHFSSEQHLFILEVDGEKAGLVHVVGKLQGTYKISPLIVEQRFRGSRGLGTLLLKTAEDYARIHQARQIYCTVALQNHGAHQFFLRRGYVAAGKSESHYKAGVTEVMLYKLFLNAAFVDDLERPNISVLPMEPHHEAGCRTLIETRLGKDFGGIDDKWVDSLFNGYRRRTTRDVNQKYKLIFVAADRSKAVLGVVGATPKKGEPIKLMPFVGANHQIFSALLTDVPFMLKEYGHKLYMHLVPTVEETIALQRQGWSLDAVMPAAYRDDKITQQWGFSLGEELMRKMRVKQGFFDSIGSGKKTLEVRVGYDSIQTIQPGERIQLMTSTAQQTIKVRDVRRYGNFAEMLEIEDAGAIAPGLSGREVLDLLRRIYPADKERLGVYVLDVAPESH
jgi:ASC-1-like (ASCH) protein/ribosomal protein S18 acetylase RimI-like enzyme